MPGLMGQGDFSPVTLHRAPWLVTPCPGKGGEGRGEVNLIADGALALGGDNILAMGRFGDLQKEFNAVPVADNEGTILCPPLVNGHAHLELSVLGEPVPAGGFPDWIRNLLQSLDAWRVTAGSEWPDRMVAEGRKVLTRLYDSGVDAVIDVGNNIASSAIGSTAPARTVFFLELLGLSGGAERDALERLEREIPPDLACTPHAPYSCGPELLRGLKKRASVAGRAMTVHVAESAEEVEFLHTGGGPFRPFLEDRGVLDPSFAIPGCGPLEYLDRLGILDRDTLCVHGVQLSDAEIDILAGRRAALCLCPGSNRHMGVGKPPVDKLLAAGMPLLLGTDSQASNESLSMWREMRLLREDNPGLDPVAVLAMATGGTAQILGLGLPLNPAAYLAVRPAGNLRLDHGGQVLDFLTLEGETAAITRIGGQSTTNSDQ